MDSDVVVLMDQLCRKEAETVQLILLLLDHSLVYDTIYCDTFLDMQ